jgi:hypothetical protein
MRIPFTVKTSGATARLRAAPGIADRRLVQRGSGQGGTLLPPAPTVRRSRPTRRWAAWPAARPAVLPPATRCSGKRVREWTRPEIRPGGEPGSAKFEPAVLAQACPLIPAGRADAATRHDSRKNMAASMKNDHHGQTSGPVIPGDRAEAETPVPPALCASPCQAGGRRRAPQRRIRPSWVMLAASSPRCRTGRWQDRPARCCPSTLAADGPPCRTASRAGRGISPLKASPMPGMPPPPATPLMGRTGRPGPGSGAGPVASRLCPWWASIPPAPFPCQQPRHETTRRIPGPSPNRDGGRACRTASDTHETRPFGRVLCG